LEKQYIEGGNFALSICPEDFYSLWQTTFSDDEISTDTQGA